MWGCPHFTISLDSIDFWIVVLFFLPLGKFPHVQCGPGYTLLFLQPSWAFTADDKRLPSVATISAFIQPCCPDSYPLLSLTRNNIPNTIVFRESLINILRGLGICTLPKYMYFCAYQRTRTNEHTPFQSKLCRSRYGSLTRLVFQVG